MERETCDQQLASTEGRDSRFGSDTYTSANIDRIECITEDAGVRLHPNGDDVVEFADDAKVVVVVVVLVVLVLADLLAALLVCFGSVIV